jgi:hypothetical protein
MRRAVVNGAAGVLVVRRGEPFTIMGFTVSDGKIVEIYVLAAPANVDERNRPCQSHRTTSAQS